MNLNMGKENKKNNNHYVDKDELYDEVVKSLNNDRITENAASMFLLMANRISSQFSYKFEQDREDVIQYAMENLLRYWKSFNPEETKNAFSYYTSMIYRGLAKGWGKLHKIKESKKIRMSNQGFYDYADYNE